MTEVQGGKTEVDGLSGSTLGFTNVTMSNVTADIIMSNTAAYASLCASQPATTTDEPSGDSQAKVPSPGQTTRAGETVKDDDDEDDVQSEELFHHDALSGETEEAVLVPETQATEIEDGVNSKTLRPYDPTVSPLEESEVAVCPETQMLEMSGVLYQEDEEEVEGEGEEVEKMQTSQSEDEVIHRCAARSSRHGVALALPGQPTEWQDGDKIASETGKMLSCNDNALPLNPQGVAENLFIVRFVFIELH